MEGSSATGGSATGSADEEAASAMKDAESSVEKLHSGEEKAMGEEKKMVGVKISALTLSARLLTGMIQQGGYINQTYTFGPLCTLPRVFNVPRCVGTHVHRTVPTGYTVFK